MAIEDAIEAQERARQGLGTIYILPQPRVIAHRPGSGRGTVVLFEAPSRATLLKSGRLVSAPKAGAAD